MPPPRSYHRRWVIWYQESMEQTVAVGCAGMWREGAREVPPQHTLSPTCREVYGTAGAGDCTEWMMHVPERPVRHTGKVSQTVAYSG